MLSDILACFLENRRFILSSSRPDMQNISVEFRSDGTLLSDVALGPHSWGIKGDFVELTWREQTAVVFDEVIKTSAGIVALRGRALSREGEDHTYHLERLAPETRLIASVVADRLVQPHTGNSVAVLIRTFKCDDKYRSLLDKLNTTRTGFDLYSLVDETRQRHDPGPVAVIWHSVQSIRELGLTQRHHDVLRHCGDFPLYVALREISSYSYYIMIEDDVELRDDDARFLGELCSVLSMVRPEVDFAGIHFSRDLNQIWGPATSRVYGDASSYLCRFPFVVISRRLLAYLFSQRQIEAVREPFPQDIMHCEVFVPSAATAGGFRCVNLNELIPGCHDASMMLFEIDGYGLPLGSQFRGSASIRLYHPVYTSSEWVGRVNHTVSTAPSGKVESMLKSLADEKSRAMDHGDAAFLQAVQQLTGLLDPAWQAYFAAERFEVRLLAPPAGDADQWHELEHGAIADFRWTKRNTIQWKDQRWPLSRKANGDATVTFLIPILMENRAGDRDHCVLRIGNASYPLKYARGSLRAEIALTRDQLGSIELEAPPLHAPCELRDSPDRRKLGFAVLVG